MYAGVKICLAHFLEVDNASPAVRPVLKRVPSAASGMSYSSTCFCIEGLPSILQPNLEESFIVIFISVAIVRTVVILLVITAPRLRFFLCIIHMLPVLVHLLLNIFIGHIVGNVPHVSLLMLLRWWVHREAQAALPRHQTKYATEKTATTMYMRGFRDVSLRTLSLKKASNLRRYRPRPLYWRASTRGRITSAVALSQPTQVHTGQAAPIQSR
mmetsp:Transcript_143688/g.358161  ORF Transcript_143688/g.358161 Transcript_143688/m.358161 type:complete len:213 (-) Transcript_143688:71-709(-)